MKDQAPVRVIGMGAVLPGARGRERARARLLDGPTAIAGLPSLRWDPAVYTHELPEGHPPVELGAVLDELELDWRALRLPPQSASRMHLMEKAAIVAMSEAIEQAGLKNGAPPGERTRVWVAATSLGPDPAIDHGRRIRRHELAVPVAAALDEVFPVKAAEVSDYVDGLFNLIAPPVEPDSMSTSASILAGRICNIFDFRGGHLAIDCSTSSSLAAIEAAVLELRAGACDVAVVCAVSPMLTASSMLVHAHRGLLSTTEPQPFSPNADGTVLGEGAIAFVLDRGDVLERDAHGWLEAVGSSTLTTGDQDPLREAITRAAHRCFEEAGRSPGEVALVASRALGVRALDEPELDALRALYGSSARPGEPLVACGTAMLGHLQAASGMMALLHAFGVFAEGVVRGPPGTLIDAEGAATRARLSLPRDGAIAVSDAGLSPVVFHALVSGPVKAAAAVVITGARAALPDLAITGMGAVLPAAEDVNRFWENVIGRVDSICDLPKSRWDVDRFIGASEELGAILRTRLAAPVELPAFDPVRFRIPPNSVPDLDPAVLLCLAASEQALGGLEPTPVWAPERVAVVSGQLPLRANEAALEVRMLFSGHLDLVRQAMLESDFAPALVARVMNASRAHFDSDHPPLSSSAITSRTGLECAAHIARVWRFSGPLASVDAACASSLAAIAHGARRLATGEVDAVVCAGVAYNLLPEYYVSLSILGALSTRGAPPFHVGADGFVPGEGAGVLVLERLDAAERRGARIHAVIRGIGISSDGSGTGIFAPNTKGEQRAIRAALEAAAVSPREVDLVEAHGTGTELGDETELHSYGAIYGDRDPSAPLTLGTVKSQIGHLSSAAGMAGLIKATFALRERVLPPTLGSEPSPLLEGSNLRLPTEARPWVVRPLGRRLAGVSAFGLGGINYHLVVEEPPASERSPRASIAPQAQAPSNAPIADRFSVELEPVSLPKRPPLASLTAKTVWIIPDRAFAWRALATALESRGARPVLARGDTFEALPAPDGIVDLSHFGPAPRAIDPSDESVLADGVGAVQRALDALRACAERFEASAARECFYVAVTGLGGQLGLTGVGDGDLTGAALLGLAKAVKQELPQTLSKGVDFDPHESAEVVAETVLRELEDGNDQLEVGWVGRRFVSRYVRQAHAVEGPTRPVREGDVILMSGGGRGVVFECALALARLGARVVVFGRSEAADGKEDHLALDDADFEAWVRERLRGLRAERPDRPVRELIGELEATRGRRELWQNLERARRDGLEVEYHRCDVTDREAVFGLVRSVRERLGHIDGVAHGAMVEWSTRLSNKTPERVARTLATKVAGMANLLAATAEDPLRIMLGFGSGAGRFGNRGQTDYAAANALMAAQLATAATHDRRGTHFVTADWTAWEGVGRAASDPDLAAAVRATGVSSISVEEGLYWFIREWTGGESGEVVVFEERMLHEWPFLGPRAEGEGERRVEIDDLGRPRIMGAWPLVDRVLEQSPGRVTAERRLDVKRDGLLAQHRLHGVPILAATFGCELLAEVAALSVPGMEVDAAFDIRVETPAKLFHERPLVLRARARVEGTDAGMPLVRVESRSRLALRGRELSQRLHHEGRVRLRPEGSAPGRELRIDELAGSARARSFFHMSRDPVTLGPLYSRGHWIQLHDRTVVGTVRAPRQRDVMDRTAWPIFQVDPLLMDTAFQIAANWDGVNTGSVSIPYGVAELRVGRRRGRNEDARVRATVTRVNDPDVYYDIDVASPDGEMLLEIRGLHLRRINKGEGDDA